MDEPLDLRTATREQLLAVIAAQQTRIAELEGQLAGLVTLQARVQELEDRLATNSHNSSKPPSSDGPGGKPHPKSQRVPSGRKPGGQPGHVGHTLQLVDEPDEVQVHAPAHCPACGESLEHAPAIRRERRSA